MFESEVLNYTAATSNATNKVTAVPSNETDVVTVRVNGEVIENGTAATWREGVNDVEITVNNTVYTVEVTK